jgi:dolichyl-phosphate beta-glucosyltransferase
MNAARSQRTIIPIDRSNDHAFVDHDLTLIIPAYNEESRLPRTLEQVRAFLDQWGINYRVIVVDDGSKDATSTFTAAHGMRFSTIRQPNGGKGSAVRTGMMAARGRVVAFTDADLPYDLSALRAAYEQIATGKRDVVFGSRTEKGAKTLVDRRWFRTVASTVFRTCMRMLVSSNVTDTQCGLKIFSNRAARQIFSRTTIDGFAFDAEVVMLTHLLELSFDKIPVTLVNEYATTISLTRNAIPMLMDVVGVRWNVLRNAYHTGEFVSTPPDEATQRKAA